MMSKYDDNNPVNQVEIPPRLVWASPWHALSTCGGAGRIGKGAGTLGTLFGALAYIVLSTVFSPVAFVLLTTVLFVVGAIAAQKTSDALGVADHGGIVIDEVVGIWLVYALIPSGPLWWIGGFIVFRFFDIVKLPPVDRIDEKIKNGWGIMLDDVVAGVYALVVMRILGWILA